METKDFIQALVAVLGLVVTIFAIRLTHKINLLKIETSKLEKFVETPGLAELIEMFKGSNATRILAKLKTAETSMDKVQELANKLLAKKNSIDAAIRDEPTARIHDRIEDNHLLFVRFRENRQSKVFLKNHFLDIPTIREVIKNNDSIFIESGSTLSYVALSIIDQLKELRPRDRDRSLKICTNNIIIYVMLLFEKYIDPVLLPGDPSNEYGATFGAPHECNECNEHTVRQFLTDNKVTAMFTTASFMDFQYGPHVGSAPNQRIKGVLFDFAQSNKIDNYLVIAADKINNDVMEQKTKPTCRLILGQNGKPITYDDLDYLDRAKQNWAKFMKSPYNHILTGSPNTQAVHQVHHQMQIYHRGCISAPVAFPQDGELLLIKGGH
jgi:hypothetical protein